MAVAQMERISIYGLKSERKAVVESLQRRGVVELKEVDWSQYGFEKPDTSQQQTQCRKAIQTAQQASAVLEQYCPEKKPFLSMLAGRKELEFQDYESFAKDVEEMLRVAQLLQEHQKEIQEQNGEIHRIQSQMQALEPWMGLTIPMDWKGTKKAAGLVGVFSESLTDKEIEEHYRQQLNERGLEWEEYPIHPEVVFQETNQTYAVIFCLKTQCVQIEELLRAAGFARPPQMVDKIPSRVIQELEVEEESCRAKILEMEAEIQSYAGMRNAFHFLEDYYNLALEKYQALEQVSHRNKVFVLEGYLPEEEARRLSGELNARYGVAVEVQRPEENEDVPVLLKNNGFAAPVESILETYSMPGKTEIDPTGIMAVFYYVLFGMMLSDAAYGLLMVIGCGWALWKYKTMETGMKRTLQMFLYCGISTALWGVVFGGYFGDAPTVIAATFFHKEFVIPPLWFAPVDEPMKMLVFSLAVGILHLFTGLGIQAWQLCRQKQYKDALFDVGFWYLLVGGAVGYLLTVERFQQILGLSLSLGTTAAGIFAACAAVGAIGIVLMSGRSSRNPVKRLFKGLYSLYNVTGYLSDILSYSRLLALGLATGVIATVFNKMGSMLGGGVGGFIFFCLIFLIGHSMNLAINLLGAYVHTNRLQFVEFFGKFYEGGGRKFAPLSQHTKYYKVKEDITHG